MSGRRWCSKKSEKECRRSDDVVVVVVEREKRDVSFDSLQKSFGRRKEKRSTAAGKIGPTTAEPTAVDAQTFNELVALGAWDKIVPECKRLATIGKITDGVLGWQAYNVLTACKEQGEDENVLKTLENIIQLLTQTLLQLEADSPARRALDEMMTLNPDKCSTVASRAKKSSKETARTSTTSSWSCNSSYKKIASCNAAFERDLALATDTDNREEFDRLTALVTAKLEAKRRTLALLRVHGYLQ